eukprot:TRINITY_DN4342_c0_g1_i2.p1 TRINITY_DN4342_c0_g1~~TRINITY_DN4342_c0_g1_i2.p1  ORF type:complete len:110 (+),score=26.66 TRINITY_DN4342_c0_g1_i2:82-411(+)
MAQSAADVMMLLGVFAFPFLLVLSTLIYKEYELYQYKIVWEKMKMPVFRNLVICSALFFAVFVAGLTINICLHCTASRKPQQKSYHMKELGETVDADELAKLNEEEKIY